MNAKLLGATETARPPVITAVMIHDAMESLPWQEIHDLRWNRVLADVHGDFGVGEIPDASPTRHFQFKSGTPVGAKKSPSQLPFPATPFNLTGHYWGRGGDNLFRGLREIRVGDFEVENFTKLGIPEVHLHFCGI